VRTDTTGKWVSVASAAGLATGSAYLLFGPSPLSNDQRLEGIVTLTAVYFVIIWTRRGDWVPGEAVEAERSRLRNTIVATAGILLNAPMTQHSGPTGVGGERTEEIESRKFTELLIDYYAHALAHARRSARTSACSAVLGGVLLLVGLGMSIWHAASDGGVYASSVSSAAGVITTTVSLLFQRDARQALAHLEGQTDKLRQDGGARRHMARALVVLKDVEDPVLRDRLRAGLIIKLASAQVSDFPPLTDGSAARSSRSDALHADAADEGPARRSIHAVGDQ